VATIKNEVINGISAPHLSGSAIFKLDKLVGYLNDNETLYMLMIKNKTKEGLITLKNVSGSDTNITLEIYKNRTKITPVYNNGNVSLIIDIYPVVTIEEVEGSKNFMKDEDLKILQAEAEKKIKAQIQYLIIKLQKNYNSDVLGFGEILEREKPKVIENFKKNRVDIFPNIKTDINVHVQIVASARKSKPISPEK